MKHVSPNMALLLLKWMKIQSKNKQFPEHLEHRADV